MQKTGMDLMNGYKNKKYGNDEFKVIKRFIVTDQPRLKYHHHKTYLS